MQTIQHTFNPANLVADQKQSAISRFFAWCDSQEKYRFGWVASILAIHGCVLAPLTVLVLAFTSNSMILWGMLIAGIAMSLIVNLAALPTKITIPVFFFSILIDIAIVVTSISSVL